MIYLGKSIKACKFFRYLLLGTLFLFSGCGAEDAQIYSIVDAPSYHNLYQPFFKTGNDLMDKITDNHGDGYEPAYGTRNMRVVLHGVMYRGGSNNSYNKYGKRDNQNPMPKLGLDNLCKEGFGNVIYLYTTNYQPYQTTCVNRWGKTQELKFEQITVAGSSSGIKKILDKVYHVIVDKVSSPIFSGCWNGWHSSGLAAATALMQFCEFTNAEALQYWIDGTGSVANSQYPSIRKQIKDFVPYAEYKINKQTQTLICPRNPYHQ